MCKRRARQHERPSLSTQWRALCSLHTGANHSCRNDTQRTKSPTGRQSTTTISKTRRPSHRLMNRRPSPCAIRRATNDPNRHSLSETDTGCRPSFSITLRDRREFRLDGLHACLLAIDVSRNACDVHGGRDAGRGAVSLVDHRRAIKQLCQDERIARLAPCARTARELVDVLLKAGNDAAAIRVELPRPDSAPAAEDRWHPPCSLSVVTPLGRRSAGRQPLPSSFIPGGRRTVASRHAFLFHQDAARSLALRPD